VFEVASYLLLVAAVGAVMLARRRRGLPGAEEPRRTAFFDAPRPAYSGTMAETVGDLPADGQSQRTPSGGW